MSSRSTNLYATLVALFAATLAPADTGTDHQAVQTRPILLGTSGGNINDISSLYCCSGTLGGLVEDTSGDQYILSNNHVLGASNLAVVGDPVNQPGMIDQNCQSNGIVGNFTALVPLKFSKGRSIVWNQVDAAIAQVVPGQVSPNGAILDIGGLSGNTLNAIPGMSVQKSGRTTGRTTGTVLAVDVTSSVGYSKECGGAANQIAYFQNQIRIGGADFSDGGDSGSIVVENGSTDPANGLPRAVGLLFAGDSTSTLANPIAAALGALGVSMVEGVVVPPGPSGTVAGFVTDADSLTPIEGATISVGALTAVSDGAGAYALTNVPAGTVTVNVAALGYLGATQSDIEVVDGATTGVDFALTPSPAPTLAQPGCIIYNTAGGKTGDRNLLISVKVVDDFGAPVSGAAVSISVTRNGAAFATGSGATTGSNGVVTYQARNATNGTYVTTVTAIQASGLTFSGAATTPINSFVKGTDAVPAEFCDAGVSPSSDNAARTLSRARGANARASAALMGVAGVAGHGVGFDAKGAVIEVYVLKSAGNAARAALPASIEGIPLRVVDTDGFLAY